MGLYKKMTVDSINYNCSHYKHTLIEKFHLFHKYNWHKIHHNCYLTLKQYGADLRTLS
jgi:hypothetical protein